MTRQMPMRNVTLVIALAMLLSSGCKKKQAPYPDLSNPKAAAVTFARAMETGDVQVARDASMAGGMELDLVDAMTQATHALKQLGNAVQAKFGDQAKDALRGTGTLNASDSLAQGDV